jgi:hypothetical protein
MIATIIPLAAMLLSIAGFFAWSVLNIRTGLTVGLAAAGMAVLFPILWAIPPQ